MDFIIIANSSFKTSGYRYVITKGIKTLIENNENYHLGKYDESISKTIIAAYNILFSTYFSQKIFQKMTNEEIDILIEDFIEKCLFKDIYDFKYQYDALLDYDNKY